MSLLAGDDLTIVLFFVGTAVSVGCAGMSAAGWRHPVLIVGLFLLAGACFFFGASWPALKGIAPASISIPVQQVSTNPVSWFVVLILGLTATLLLPRRRTFQSTENNRVQKAISLEPPIIAIGIDSESHTGRTPALEERTFVAINPSELVNIFRTRTSVQAKALTAKYIGKWTSITSQITNVSGNIDWLSVQFYDDEMRVIISATCTKPVSERAIHFTQGATVTAEGQIEEIDGMAIRLKDCDFS